MNEPLPDLPQMLKVGTISAASLWARWSMTLSQERYEALAAMVDGAGFRPTVLFQHTPDGWTVTFAVMDSAGGLQPLEVFEARVPSVASH